MNLDPAIGVGRTSRGRLRVYLGAAPGVGKTFRMLEEGRRRRARGTDVVVAIVETHGRPRTMELVEGFEVVPRLSAAHRGAVLLDMDLDAVLARRPQVALVDELAHTNAPGLRNEKRWQDVEVLLEHGIDVITTVNIQHLESLNDAVYRITGVEQRETIPDHVVRNADQVELVDMAPDALRRRIVHGNVYPRERVEAALGNYFRVGNLTALRELALLWVADRVDDDLRTYRTAENIQRPWETRERLVVALTGGPTGDDLIRRAARLAERSRADLVGVHVRRSDGLSDSGSSNRIAEHRRLLTDLGGRYHEVAGDDAAATLVEFARSVNATQLVLGSSRRSRSDEILRGSVVNDAIRSSRDIDVHVVAHRDAETDVDEPRHRAPRTSTWATLPVRRRMWSLIVAIAGPVLLTLLFIPFRDDEEGLPGVLPAYMFVVVVAALIGGTLPAVLAAAIGFTLGNVVLTRPYGTLRVTDVNNVIALVSFLAVAVSVAVLVGQLARRSADAERARNEARALASAAATVVEDDAVPELLDRLRSVLRADLVAVVDDGAPVALAGDERLLVDAATGLDLDGGRQLVAVPPVTRNDDLSIARAFGDQLVAAMRRSELVAAEREARTLGEIDRFRTALLRSVSHDLRTPLASIMAAASSLAQDDVEWPDDARSEFVLTILDGAERLDRIIANLLDASRLEAGVLAVDRRDVHLDELVGSTVRNLFDGDDVDVLVPDDIAPVLADPALLERVLDNLITNALRHGGGEVTIDALARPIDGLVELRVIDHGPGVDPANRPAMFSEFQRLDDHGAGVGLGLSVASGLVEAMGGAIEPSDTPGGGLTMSLLLPTTTGRAQ